jgi:hypothetical protein
VRADFDMDDDRRGSRRDSVLRVLTITGEAVLVVGALALLFLAFRGPSGHPTTSAAPAAASTSPSSSSVTGGPGAGQGAGTRPATVPSAASAATVTPSPSASASASATAAAAATARQAAGPLGARVQSYLAGRRGKTEVAVYDVSSGQQWTLGAQAPQAEESVVDLEILEAVLHQRRVQRTVLSLTEQELAPPLIEESDTAATTTLWSDVGGSRGMRAFDHAAGLAHTSPSNCLQCSGSSAPGWGLTTTTPQDQITLLRQLARPSRVLDAKDQKYARYLLENVELAQRWGVCGGVPAGVTVALKNGVQPLNAAETDWQVNSVGWVSGDGRNYLMAVLSTGNPSEQYGIDTLNHLGAMEWSALASVRG